MFTTTKTDMPCCVPMQCSDRFDRSHRYHQSFPHILKVFEKVWSRTLGPLIHFMCHGDLKQTLILQGNTNITFVISLNSLRVSFLVTIKQTGWFWTLRSSLQVGYFFTSSWFVSHSKLVGFLLQVSWFITSKWLPVKTERLS